MCPIEIETDDYSFVTGRGISSTDIGKDHRVIYTGDVLSTVSIVRGPNNWPIMPSTRLRFGETVQCDTSELGLVKITRV